MPASKRGPQSTNKKRDHSVGYFSSYDRGLRCLLELWPEVLKKVPKATLEIYYGWDMYDKVNAQNADQMKKKWQMIRLMSDPSITDHGRVSHAELAKAMKAIKVWAYPTEWTEINCITALKAQEAGMIPVTTDCYGLETSVLNKDFSVKCTDIYTNKQKQAEFIKQVIRALNTDQSKIKPKIKYTSDDWYWPNIAKKWQEILI